MPTEHMPLMQILPQDWSPATVRWIGWQDQNVGCEWQWQVHAHIHGLHKGVQPVLVWHVYCLQVVCEMSATYVTALRYLEERL